MKKLLLMLSTALMLIFTGCMQFDDTRIWDAIDELEDLYDNLDGRLEKLEEECEKMNTNIEALQTLVSALQAQDTITTIAPIKQGDKIIGYTISFSKSEPITIYHGEDGKDGADGEDGKDGANGSDGYTPTIGVAKDADENYYWTLDGEWLLDAEGNKIKANGNEGKDGADGEDGEDGITPKLEIRDGYWYISYDNGQSWVELGKATGEDGKDGANGADGADGEDDKDGENGKDGADGDSLFQSVTWDEEYVYFTLSDGSMIIIPLSVGVGVEPPQSTNEIWYTSTDGTIVEPYDTSVFGANIVSNTYKYGKGVITFDGDVTSIGKKAFRNCKSLTNITIPEGITEIGEDAFSYCKSLASVTIPDSVTEIGASAFYNCTGLTSVHITDLNAWCAIDFTNYQANPIYYAQNLYLNNNLVTDLVIPNNLTAIKNYGFVNCTSLRRVIIPEGVISIGSGVFDGCSSLTNITFPASVTTIDGWALADCTGLTSVTIPNTINSIGNSAFANCTGELIIKNKNLVETNHGANDNTWLKNSLFEKITIAPDNNITSIGSFAFKDCVSTTSISIPQGVTSIGFSAFKGCSSLISTNIPDSVTSIGDMAFFECSSLVDLTIPDSVVSIGDGVINRCPNITNLQSKYASEDGYCLIVDGVLVSFSGHNLTEFTIPDGVTALGELAFYFCSNLESITIPASVTSSGDYAFQYTPALKSVHIADLAVWCSIEFNNALANPLTNSAELYLNGELVVDLVIPDSVTKIGRGSFRDCSSVISVTIPNSVVSIGSSAFNGCSSLTSITIPNSVTSIGEWAFWYCTSLTSVYCKATTPPTGDDYMFDNNASGRKIYVPTESVEAYKTAEGWSEYADDIVGYNFQQ